MAASKGPITPTAMAPRAKRPSTRSSKPGPSSVDDRARTCTRSTWPMRKISTATATTTGKPRTDDAASGDPACTISTWRSVSTASSRPMVAVRKRPSARRSGGRRKGASPRSSTGNTQPPSQVAVKMEKPRIGSTETVAIPSGPSMPVSVTASVMASTPKVGTITCPSDRISATTRRPRAVCGACIIVASRAISGRPRHKSPRPSAVSTRTSGRLSNSSRRPSSVRQRAAVSDHSRTAISLIATSAAGQLAGLIGAGQSCSSRSACRSRSVRSISPIRPSARR